MNHLKHHIYLKKSNFKEYVINDDLYKDNEAFFNSIKKNQNSNSFLNALQKKAEYEYKSAIGLNKPIANMVFFGHWGWAFAQMIQHYKNHVSDYVIIPSVEPIFGCSIYQYWRGGSRKFSNLLKTFNHKHDFVSKGIDMFHDSPNDNNRSNINVRMERLKLLGGSFCTSMEQYQFLKNRNKMGKNHVYIPLGAREDIITKTKYNEKNKIRIGFVGRKYYDGVKGESRLYEIAKKLDPNKFEFIILAPNLEKISNDIKKLGFNLYENKNDFINLYSMIDVTLILSKYEGTPLPLIESMKFGHTVLSTKVGEAPVLLGGTPYILNTDDEFVKTLNKIECDRTILKNNIKVNSKKVEGRTWKSFADLSVELWKKL